MASEIDSILRDLIDSVTQRPQFSARGRPTQVVMVDFHTPHGFTGTVTMSLEDWKDSGVRSQKVMQAVVDLEGPFWDAEEAIPGGG